MKFGLSGMSSGALATAEACTRMSQAAEAAGFESLWTGEHLVLPDPPIPMPPPSTATTKQPQTPTLDPLIAYAYMAAHTERIRLATGVMILPQRNPVVLAKQIATLDVLSGGRFILGIGVGWLEPEMSAIGVPMEHRGSRSDEYLQAMISLWDDTSPSFDGRWVSFSAIDAYPRPVQRPHPHIVIGGDSPAALRRAARHGDGWYGFDLDVEQSRAAVDEIRSLKSSLEISVSPKGGLVQPGEARAYAAVGVDRLIFRAPTSSLGAALEYVENARPSMTD